MCMYENVLVHLDQDRYKYKYMCATRTARPYWGRC